MPYWNLLQQLLQQLKYTLKSFTGSSILNICVPGNFISVEKLIFDKENFRLPYSLHERIHSHNYNETCVKVNLSLAHSEFSSFWVKLILSFANSDFSLFWALLISSFAYSKFCLFWVYLIISFAYSIFCLFYSKAR